MRLGVAAVAICLAIVGVSAAQNAAAAMNRKPTNIPAQPLSSALEALAKERDLQVIYRSDVVRSVQSAGAVGVFTPEETLTKLLSGTGLTYRYLNETTVTITPASTSPPPPGPSSAAPDQPTTALPPTSDSQKEPANSGAFLLAQATSGQPASAASVESLQKRAAASEIPLQEVIVTAQKRAERLQDVPISISVLTGAQLESAPISSVADALGTVPGVAASRAYLGGGTMVTIRGVASGSWFFAGSSPVAYYIDSAPFGFVKTAIAPDQDVYDLQQIEVLRGPQGTLYGANALNGVVRILSNDPDLNTYQVKVRGADSGTEGGGNNYRGDVTANVPIVNGTLAARAVVGYERDSGWIDTPIENNVNDSELENFRFKIKAQPTDNLSIGLSWWGVRDKYGAPPTSDDNAKSPSVVNQPIVSDYDAYALKVGYGASGYSLSSTTSYLEYTNKSNIDFTSLLGGFPYALYTDINTSLLSEEVLLTSPTDGPWRWSTGAMWRRATEVRYQNDSIVFPPGVGLNLSNDVSKSYAVFGEVTRVMFGGKLDATAGVRYFGDEVNQFGNAGGFAGAPLIYADGRFHATTPRGVLTWHPNADVMIYGSFSEGFRSGFPQDVTTPPGFAPVKPDRLYNYEAGTKGSLWGGRLSFDTSVYYMDWKDVQQSLQVPAGLIYTTAVVNGASASGPGVDFQLSTQVATGLTLSVDASWNDLKMDSVVFSNGVLLFHKGDRLNFSPETTIGAQAAYAFHLSGDLTGRLGASVNYTSAQIFRINPGGPTVDLGVGDSMLIGKVSLSVESSRGWTATLFVNNIGNAYPAVVRAYLDPVLTPRVQPRTAGVQAEYRFN